MRLTSINRGWQFEHSVCRIQQIIIDFRVQLLLVEESSSGSSTKVIIETPFRLSENGIETEVQPSSTATLAPILTLFNREVERIVIDDRGTLSIEIADGIKLVAEADGDYEAWQVGSSDGFLVVCAPGGRVDVFREDGPTPRAL